MRMKKICVTILILTFFFGLNCKETFKVQGFKTPPIFKNDMTFKKDFRNQAYTPKELREYYTSLIEKKTPFKSIKWANNYVEEGGIRRAVLMDDIICLESKNLHIWGINTESGITQWTKIIPEKLVFDPSYSPDIPRKQAKLKSEYNKGFESLALMKDAKNSNIKAIEKLKRELKSKKNIYEAYDKRDTLYLVTSEKLLCISRKYGALIWEKDLNIIPSFKPTASYNYVFFPSLIDDIIHTIDAFDPDAPSYKAYRLDSQNTAPVLFVDPFLYAVTKKGSVYAFDEKGDLKWKYSMEKPSYGGVVKSPSNSNTDIVLVGSVDYAIYAINRATGSTKWKYESGGAIVQPPQIIGDRVYFYSEKNSFFALSLDSGKLIWKNPDYRSALIKTAKKFYCYNENGEIISVNYETGEMIEKYDKLPFKFVIPDYKTNNVYFISEEGYIFSAMESKSEF